MVQIVSLKPRVLCDFLKTGVHFDGLPERVALAHGGAAVGAAIGQMMLHQVREGLDRHGLERLAIRLGQLLSLSSVQVGEIVKALHAWRNLLVQGAPVRLAGLVKGILDVLPPSDRKRIPALGELQRKLKHSEMQAREILERLKKQPPDLSGKSLQDRVLDEAAEMARRGEYWTAFALEQLARGFKPGPSSPTVPSTAKKTRPTRKFSDGWAPTHGPFRTIDMGEVKRLSAISGKQALRYVIDFADQLVAQGKLTKLSHSGFFSAIYVDKQGRLHRISLMNDLEWRFAKAAASVDPPIGPRVSLEESLFVPARAVRSVPGSSWEGPAIMTMERLTGPTLSEALSAAYAKEQVRLVHESAKLLGRAHGGLYVWHGDLKPDNIVLDASGNLRMIDFQMAESNRIRVAESKELEPEPFFNDLRALLSKFLKWGVDKEFRTEREFIVWFRKAYVGAVHDLGRRSNPPGAKPEVLRAMEKAFDRLEKEGLFRHAR
jgi:hypothetical protein